MRTCRELLAAGGFDDVVALRGWRAKPLPRAETGRMLEHDESHADRDDYWWSGVVCWTDATRSRIVSTDYVERPGLQFVGWGRRANQMLERLADLAAR